jgi:short-subunit dehydrogenase
VSDLQGKTALITGASGGLGAAFARELAARRCDLVLTARRRERLEALAAELAPTGVKVRCVAEDLSDPAGPARLEAAAGPVDVLINNAGLAAFERFVDVDWERHRAILQVDVASMCELAWRTARRLAARPERGYILNVASTAALAPVQGFALYGAAKAFVWNFSMALAAETAGTALTVTATSPGPVATEFMDVAGMTVTGVRRLGLMGATRCVRGSIRAMLRGQRSYFPGVLPKLMAFGSRLAPARLNGAVGGMMLGSPPTRRLDR